MFSCVWSIVGLVDAPFFPDSVFGGCCGSGLSLILMVPLPEELRSSGDALCSKSGVLISFLEESVEAIKSMGDPFLTLIALSSKFSDTDFKIISVRWSLGQCALAGQNASTPRRIISLVIYFIRY